MKHNRMKILLLVLVVVCLSLVLSGCCIVHDWQDATCLEPKTCAKCGKTSGEPLGHVWVEATCTEPQTCSVCGATYGDALGHDVEPATCTEDAVCKVCGERLEKALGHDWEAANCLSPKTCKRCGLEEGEIGDHVWVDASCSAPKTCSICGLTEGEPLEHSWVAATCTDPETCELCGETRGEALGHKWKDADYDNPKTCSVCGATEGKPVPKPDYFWNEKNTEDTINISFYNKNGWSWVEVTCDSIGSLSLLDLYREGFLTSDDKAKTGAFFRRFEDLIEYMENYGYDKAWASGSVYNYQMDILADETWILYMETNDNRGGLLGIKCNIPEFVTYYANGSVDYRLK